MTNTKKKIIYSITFSTFLLSSCAVKIDPIEVKPDDKAPVSLEIKPLNIPLNNLKPKYLLYIEKPISSAEKLKNSDFLDPLKYNTSEEVKINGYNPSYIPPVEKLTQNTDNIVAEQLAGAIGKVENFILLDEIPEKDKLSLELNECGPYYVKMLITEFAENAESSDSLTEGNFSKAISVFGNQFLNTLNPSFGNKEAIRTGSVTFILKVVNQDNHRMLFSETAHGTFTAKTKTSAFRILGTSSGGNAFAASALGQATQAALNDAAQKLFDKFTKLISDTKSSMCTKITADADGEKDIKIKNRKPKLH